MLGHQFAYSAMPIRKVKEVQFGILSPEEIVRSFALVFLNEDSYPFTESALCRQDRVSRSHGRGNAQAEDGWSM